MDVRIHAQGQARQDLGELFGIGPESFGLFLHPAQLAAATIFMALVICRVFLMAEILFWISRSAAISLLL
jgi:hypothetical protein